LLQDAAMLIQSSGILNALKNSKCPLDWIGVANVVHQLSAALLCFSIV